MDKEAEFFKQKWEEAQGNSDLEWTVTFWIDSFRQTLSNKQLKSFDKEMGF